MSDSGQRLPWSAGDRERSTWRVACTFSLLALALSLNLADTLWTVSGPRGTIVEFVLRYIIWLYTFALCALSLYLAVATLRRARQERKRAGTTSALVAVIIAILATVLTYCVYRLS